MEQLLKKITQIKGESKEAVGVDIGEERVTVAMLRSAPAPEIKGAITRPIARSATDEELGKIIKEIFSQKGLPKKGVWLNIGTHLQGLSISRISLPIMPQKDIPDAMRWNLKDSASLDINTAELAYEVIGEVQKEDGSKAQGIIACAVEKSLLDRYLGIFKQAGIILAGINVTPFSISNVLKAGLTSSGKKGSVVVVNIGVEHTCLCFYRDGTLTFVRQIPLGASGFLNAMTGVLVSDKGRVELNEDDARKIIEEVGIPKDTDSVLGDKVQPSQLVAMVRPVVEQFAGEILRSIDYYQREFGPAEAAAGAERIDELLIAGRAAEIKGFTEILSEYLKLKVERLNLPGGVLSLFAVGAMLGSKGKINLLPFEIKVEKKEALAKTVIRVSAIAVFGSLLLSFLLMNERIKQRQKELNILKNQRVMLAELKDMRDKIVGREAAISDIIGKDIPIDVVLKELSNVTPGNIAFAELWLNQSQGKLRLTGRVGARPEAVQNALSDFMKALEKATYIKDANLLNVQIGAAGADADSSEFEISCILKN